MKGKKDNSMVRLKRKIEGMVIQKMSPYTHNMAVVSPLKAVSSKLKKYLNASCS